MVTAISLEEPSLSEKEASKKLAAIALAFAKVGVENRHLIDFDDRTGFNNIRLQRQGNYTHSDNPAETRSLDESQPIDNSNENLFNPFAMFIDYLRGEVLLSSYRDLKELLTVLLPDKRGGAISQTVAEMPYTFSLVPGIREYEYGYKDSQTGAIVAYQPIMQGFCDINFKFFKMLIDYDPLLSLDFNQDNVIGYRVLVQLGGDWFRSMKLIDALRLIKYLDERSFKAQRVDLAVDVPKSFRILENAASAVKGRRFTNLKCGEYRIKLYPRGIGETVNVGSRESYFFMRIYDTEVKHGYKADRTEGEFKRDKARQVYRMIADIPFYTDPSDKMSRMTNQEIVRNAQQLMANLLTGQFDFYDDISIAANGSITDTTYCDWWLKFKEKILAYNPIRVTVQPPEKTIPKTFGWLFRQVSKSLAIFYAGMKGNGAKLIKSLLDYGKERFTSQDEALIQALKEGLVNLEIG